MSLARKTFRPALVLAFGTGLLWLATAGGATEETAKNSSDQVRQLLQERLAIAEKIVDLQSTLYQRQRVDFDDLLDARTDALRIKLELARSTEERVEIYKNMIDVAKKIAKYAHTKQEAGRASMVDVLEGESQVLKYRIALAREQTTP